MPDLVPYLAKLSKSQDKFQSWSRETEKEWVEEEVYQTKVVIVVGGDRRDGSWECGRN